MVELIPVARRIGKYNLNDQLGNTRTGVIVHKAADGSLGLNQGVKDLVSRFSPRYKEQQKRERTQVPLR